MMLLAAQRKVDDILSLFSECCTMPTFVLSGNNKKNCLDNKRGCKILKLSHILTHLQETFDTI